MTDSSFECVIDWQNLLSAYQKAARSKRGKQNIADFEKRVADHLVCLQRELSERSYQPGQYVHFMIHDPKQRKISAAPFRDRVVHHAVCNIIEPIFDARFIEDSYANRIGKGTHRAIDQFQDYSRRYQYVLRADIVKHFPSIDHEILLNILQQTIQDEGIRWLMQLIVGSGKGVLDDEYQMVYFPHDDLFAVNRSRGLPIGNLTSQFWSNCYLNPFDWFVIRELGCKAYLRYVDDFALFSNSKPELHYWKQQIIRRLQDFRLIIHETEAQVVPVEHGIPWLGFVVYPTHRLLKSRNVVKFSRRIQQRWEDYCYGKITFAEFDASVQGWINHVRYGDTWGLREHVLGRGFQRPPNT